MINENRGRCTLYLSSPLCKHFFVVIKSLLFLWVHLGCGTLLVLGAYYIASQIRLLFETFHKVLISKTVNWVKHFTLNSTLSQAPLFLVLNSKLLEHVFVQIFSSKTRVSLRFGPCTLICGSWLDDSAWPWTNWNCLIGLNNFKISRHIVHWLPITFFQGTLLGTFCIIVDVLNLNLNFTNIFTWYMKR